MDARFLNFHGGEQFSTFDSAYFQDPSGDESQASEDANNRRCSWDWDRERELNGDIGLIPVTNNTNGDFCVLSTSPPSKEDFHKIMCDWQQLVNVELEDIEVLTTVMLSDDSERNELIEQSTSESFSKFSEPIFGSRVDSTQESMCDNAERISPLLKIEDEENIRDEDTKKDFSTHTFKKRQISYGGKKIDMKNQRYVLDSDSDEDSHVDVETLSDISIDEKNCAELTENILSIECDLPECLEMPDCELGEEVGSISNNLVTDCDSGREIDSAPNDLDTVYELKQEIDCTPNNLVPELISCTENGESSLIDEKGCDWGDSKSELSLPNIQCDEKSLSPVIEAVDLNSLLEQFEAKENEIQQNYIGVEDVVENKSVVPQMLPLELSKSPMNKRKPSSSVSIACNMKRENVVVSVPSTMVRLDHNYCRSSSFLKKESDSSSSCDEDEQTVLHSQPTVKTADGKLMVSLLKINTIKKRKLNLEEYKQLRKNRRSNYASYAHRDENARRLRKMCVQPVPPSNMEIKILVSIGVNTDQSWGRLQELVNGYQVNFGMNSLITSLVDHLPKNENKFVEVGEDKTIVYLEKDRAVPIKTSNKSSQTSFHQRSPSSASSCSSRSSRSASKSPPPRKRVNSSERVREVEERRVIYVGRIEDFMTREDLRKRFERFGPVSKVSVHFRKTGDNYGFVTFKYRQDAYKAVEHGNDDVTQPQYDLSFGGRRMFCQTSYADLDNVHDNEIYPAPQPVQDNTFDLLLREARAKLFHNKKEG